MKKITWLFALLLSVSFSFAQDKGKEKLMKDMCEDACTAIKKTDFGKKDNADELKMKLGLAIIPVMEKYREQIRKEYGLDISEPNDMTAIAEKMGTNLVFYCPKFQDITMDMVKKDDSILKEINDEANSSAPADSEIKGIIEKIEGSEINTIYVKTEGDETIRLYWLQSFINSELLESWNQDSKQSFRITYRLDVIYSPKTKKYSEVKVISGIYK
jgi:hypothetical protein